MPFESRFKPRRIDSTRFFRMLAVHFPLATTFYVEGTSIADDVRACYEAHAEDGEYLPDAQTIAPLSEKHRCRHSSEFMEALAELSLRHAEPEILDHLHLYEGDAPLVLWADAFSTGSELSVSGRKDTVAAFAGDLGL